MTEVDVCVCTYRRPSVTDTLASLDAMVLPDNVHLRILVVDNDQTPSARGRVRTFAQKAGTQIDYLHCPASNISIARNGALSAGSARFLAFIDDDEEATPGWLAALLATQQKTGAAAVLGPVRADYDETAPAWMQAAKVHATRPVWVDGTIRTGYTCNALIDRHHPSVTPLQFDLSLGRSGGEDTTFFAELHARGGRIAFARDALVTEPVPDTRASFGWLAKRRFRMGQTHAHVLRRDRSFSPIWEIPKAAAKTLACLGLAGAFALTPPKRNLAILRACLHAGVVAALIGKPTLELYGAEPPHPTT